MQRDIIFKISIICSLFCLSMLQFLSYFKFIDWKPNQLITSTLGYMTEQQFILFILLILLIFMYFLICTFILNQLTMLSPYINSLLFATLTIWGIQWILKNSIDLSALFKLETVPLFALFAIIFRMIAGTTYYYKEQLKKA